MTSVKTYLPEMLLQIREFDVLLGIVDDALAAFESALELAREGQFVSTADEAHLRRLAASMKIDPIGSAEDVRFAVRAALLDRRPYTWPRLLAYLDETVGAGNYTAARDLSVRPPVLSVGLRAPTARQLRTVRAYLEAVVPAAMQLDITQIQEETDE